MAQVFQPSANTISRLSLGGLVAVPGLLLVTLSGITRSSYNTKVDVPLDQPVPFSHQHHALELGIDCRYCHSTVEKSPVAGVPPTHTCMSCHSQIWTNSPLLEPVRQSYRTLSPIKGADGEPGWNRINSVPDFVYFNHAIHINRGINCNICHGPVQQMQLTYKGQAFFMSWCLDCHRNPEKAIYKDSDPKYKDLSPREQVFNLYWKAQSLPSHELTYRDRALLSGKDYNPSAEELEKGEAIAKDLGVKKDQLTDCWTCHR